MQISDAAGHYTQKLLHRRASPHTICSLSCSCSWGGLITDLEPLFFVQHASLDTLVSNLSNCFLSCFLLFLTENWRCRHFVATRDVRWPKFAGTGKERNAFPFKKDLSLARSFSFFLFPRTGLSSLSYLSWD